MFPVLSQYTKCSDSDVGKTTTNQYYHTREYNPEYDDNKLIDDIAREISDLKFETTLYDNEGNPKYNLQLNTPMDDSFQVDPLIEEQRVRIYEQMLKEKPQDIKIVDSLMVSSYVQDKETIVKEGEKIIAYLNKFFLSEDQNAQDAKIYKDLRFICHNRYVYVYRSDLPLKDVITEELFSDNPTTTRTLKHLGNISYDNSINYDVLRQIILMRPIQFLVQEDKERFNEAKKILSQEFVIALNPQPRYQLWTLIQLIKLWYCDTGMQNYVKKIRILVNQWEANSEKDFNKKRGAKPSITVHPRYGKKSASIVISRIANYFVRYMNAITWTAAVPHEFVCYLPLIYYTSTNDAMKSFYEKVIKSAEKQKDFFHESRLSGMKLEVQPVRLQRHT